MKKLFARFMKDTRGVVMLEYIILGLFAVAITLVGVATLGKAYNNGLIGMAYATTGSATEVANTAAYNFAEITTDVVEVNNYAASMVDGGAATAAGVSAAIADYDIYTK